MIQYEEEGKKRSAGCLDWCPSLVHAKAARETAIGYRRVEATIALVSSNRLMQEK